MDLAAICSHLENGYSEDENEDDYTSYFLQPASSPYNMGEKIEQANIDWFDISASGKQHHLEKTSKVKFKEELASYEPDFDLIEGSDLTDDDVNSIESDDPVVAVDDNSNNVVAAAATQISLNVFDIDEEDEQEEEIILEEVASDFEENDNQEELVKPASNTLLVDDIRNSSDNDNNRGSANRIKAKRKKVVPTAVTSIDCRSHCIERLDFDLSMSIKRLEIHEKPPLPLLKLRDRKCCELPDNASCNLPCYNGLRSEYGLSSAELERRERRREIIQLKEQKRRRLLEEYKNRKNQQNEAVFCQWLRDVAARRKEAADVSSQKRRIDKSGANCGKQCLSPTVINLPAKSSGVEEKERRARPKTAAATNELVSRHGVKKAKRPHTSPACVFIEVPHKLLERGIAIGDLLVTKSKIPDKKMHIFSA